MKEVSICDVALGEDALSKTFYELDNSINNNTISYAGIMMLDAFSKLTYFNTIEGPIKTIVEKPNIKELTINLYGKVDEIFDSELGLYLIEDKRNIMFDFSVKTESKFGHKPSFISLINDENNKLSLERTIVPYPGFEFATDILNKLYDSLIKRLEN
jgi:hypothetical protein